MTPWELTVAKITSRFDSDGNLPRSRESSLDEDPTPLRPETTEDENHELMGAAGPRESRV